MARVQIRDSLETDIEAVETIYAHHVLNGLASFETIPPSQAVLSERRLAVLDAGLPYLVAELEGEILGYCYAGSYRPRPAYRFSVEDSVYIRDTCRGRGVGSLLLGALIERCEAGKWRQMIAVIGDSENKASIGLHQKMGFEPVGVFKSIGFKFDCWVDSVLMQRSLSDGGRTPPRD